MVAGSICIVFSLLLFYIVISGGINFLKTIASFEWMNVSERRGHTYTYNTRAPSSQIFKRILLKHNLWNISNFSQHLKISTGHVYGYFLLKFDMNDDLKFIFHKKGAKKCSTNFAEYCPVTRATFCKFRATLNF